jgi:cytochrome oxidase Cu insertion factor (SCO1/SenC/PrrC family)
MRLLLFAGVPLLLAAFTLLASPSCAGSSGLDDLEATLLPAGAAVPDVTVTGMDDQPLALASLRGQTVLVNFWFYH